MEKAKQVGVAVQSKLKRYSCCVHYCPNIIQGVKKLFSVVR